MSNRTLSSTDRDDIHRRIRGIALPMILSNLSVPLLGIVDTAVLGHLPSPDYLAAVAIGATLFSLVFWGFGFLRQGTTGLVAQAEGAEDHALSSATFWRALVLAQAIAFTILALSPVILGAGMAIMASTPEVEQLAASYFQIRVIGAPLTLGSFVLMGYFIGRGDARTPLAMTICANVVNIALDLLFVLGLGWDVRGVAAASVIGELASTSMGVALIYRSRALHKPPADLLKRLIPYRRILVVNRDILLRTICLVGVFAFVTWWGTHLGKGVLAANAVLLNFQHFMAYALDGFAHAAEALVGRYLGAARQQHLKFAIRATGIWSAGVALTFTLLFLLGGAAIIDMLTDIETVRTEARLYLSWQIVMPIIAVTAFWLDGVFIGATWSSEMRNTMVVSTAVFLAVWVSTIAMGNHGLWLAFLIFMGARGATMVWVLRKKLRQMPVGAI